MAQAQGDSETPSSEKVAAAEGAAAG